ncbi:TetR/AcrR family transcriptional regulator [Saccharopolyspora sp. K220]|uniref:TetR/AcrR family transcriptional regulator n=1 Tax=Saccharopolyspora soli TaxID=2926618 RepID=UPI001F57FC77|nr:TetR/AcrR family transcriptional regulator [Saccharopolyspora soli]MCI2418754.1 TetR/AcrR family transcriptional regulator [Saccharopolyspora soli]
MARVSRKYELRQRADAMEATRQRITDATIELHGTVGPAHTTIAAIAARAGVQRHTVYRHFPTDDDLFAACSTRYWAEHPWPDPATWKSIDSADERLATALDELYAFYSTVATMLANALRDAETVPVVRQALATYHAYLDEVARVLAQPFRARGARGKLVAAAVRHAISFRTWESLVQQNGIAPTTAIRLMTATVRAAAAPAPGS